MRFLPLLVIRGRAGVGVFCHRGTPIQTSPRRAGRARANLQYGKRVCFELAGVDCLPTAFHGRLICYIALMRWLLHGQLASSVADALKRHEHTPVSLVDAGLTADSTPQEVLEAAKAKQLDILTSESTIGDAAFKLDLYLYRCIVHLQVAGGDVEQDDAIDRLFKRYKRLSPDRLYTVTEKRVKVRQLPTKI